MGGRCAQPRKCYFPSSDAALRSAASPSDERAHVRQPQRRASVSASPQPFDKTPQAEPLNIYLLYRSFIENRSFLFALPFFAYCVFFVFKSIISSAFQFFGRPKGSRPPGVARFFLFCFIISKYSLIFFTIFGENVTFFPNVIYLYYPTTVCWANHRALRCFRSITSKCG